jgi:hypothetical protein
MKTVRFFILFIFAKLGFSKLTPAGKVSKALSIADDLDGNPNFPTTDPTIEEITEAANELHTAVTNAENDDREMIAIRNDKESVLDVMIRTLQADINRQAKGDPVKILSAGLEPSATRSPVGKLGPVEGLTARATMVPGEVFLKWKAISKTKVYVVQYAASMPGPMGSWQYAGEATKASLLIEGLQSGQMFYFRVACITAAGLGNWSEAITCKAY